MGGELVRLAFAVSFAEDERGTPLTMNERGALLYVCSTAHDADRPPRYWGGRDAIARYALGRRVPDGLPSAELRRAQHSINESVRKAVDGLVKRGMLLRAGEAFPGRNQEYLIQVETMLALGRMEQPEIGPSST
jgi:hypothetical protein